VDLVELFPLFSELVLKIRPGSPGTGDPLVVSPSERHHIEEAEILKCREVSGLTYLIIRLPDPLPCTPSMHPSTSRSESSDRAFFGFRSFESQKFPAK